MEPQTKNDILFCVMTFFAYTSFLYISGSLYKKIPAPK